MESRNIDEEAFQQDFKQRHCDICNKTFSSAKVKRTTIHLFLFLFYTYLILVAV